MIRPSIFWTPSAIRSLEETSSFLFRVWNDRIVDEFLSLVDRKIELIIENPEIGVKLRKTNYRKILIHRNVSLFYKHVPEKSMIQILLLWDNRMDPSQLKKHFENDEK
ncbi:type II toxin-antitoxin system RelE/ParE family toxin [Algoriphagus sp. H41]|uniref:Type II toxin-antitoxin system RelE/ParE family toxin n=1 Tax=Algoriphagus oliviformis TaxID=2811231 RepID=A0ABS3C3C5_9BACT|nr:type II toxin-antitoxin system RelE/ParE family toxin [Algoriphagus oliviformis]